MRFVCLSIITAVILSCSTTRHAGTKLNELFTRDTLFNDHFTGFLLYDPATKKNIYEFNPDHFFTPASNTKIFTLFAALKTLPDSIPSLEYALRNDSIYIWGLGDPTLLNPEFKNEDNSLRFVGSLGLPVIFCKDNFQSKHFGAGWAWDDYLYAYQAEKSSFPVFGNLMYFNYDQLRNEMVLLPEFCEVNFQPGASFQLERDLQSNTYSIEWPENNGDLVLRSPLHLTDSLLTSVFSHYVKSGFTISQNCPELTNKKIKYGVGLDTIYAALMQHSNNFIAEQLLLSVSAALTDTLDTQVGINRIGKKYLHNIAHEMQWYDGSGLSRYNQFTPRAIVNVLEQIYRILPPEKIKDIFPAGGKSGTIRSWYANENGPPFIYAKTGTLRNVHCLSGYLFTDSGKTLIFSFMHNNFKGSSSKVKRQMNTVLQNIKANQ